MTSSIKAANPSVRLDEGRLFVRDRRRTILGGEIHNSNSSSLEAIDQSFRRVKELGADCVLAPVSWEQLEPVETHFDFTLVDGILDSAREVGLDVIPLWFGSWKNGTSSYVPPWVKTDPERFLRAEVEDGSLEVLSPFAPSNWQADARAFAALMRRLREMDTDGRVVLVQVENEVGLLGGARDLSPSAATVWNGAVPPRSSMRYAPRRAPGQTTRGLPLEGAATASGPKCLVTRRRVLKRSWRRHMHVTSTGSRPRDEQSWTCRSTSTHGRTPSLTSTSRRPRTQAQLRWRAARRWPQSASPATNNGHMRPAVTPATPQRPSRRRATWSGKA